MIMYLNMSWLPVSLITGHALSHQSVFESLDEEKSTPNSTMQKRKLKYFRFTNMILINVDITHYSALPSNFINTILSLIFRWDTLDPHHGLVHKNKFALYVQMESSIPGFDMKQA